MVKRLYFLDYLRGLAIIGVVVNHAIVYGIMLNNENALTYLPKSPLVIFAPFMVFATWTGLFSIINGIGISYNLIYRLEQGIPLKKTLKSPLIHSTSILITHFVFQIFFTRRTKPIIGEEPWFSIGTGSILENSLQPLNLLVIFRSDALSSIAMSGYFACLVIGLIWRQKENITNTKRTMRILIETAAVWLAVSSSLWNFMYYRLFLPCLSHGGIFYGFALILSLIAPHGHGILPYGAYTIVGILFGYALAIKISINQLKQTAKRFAWGLIGTGTLLILFHLLTVPDISLNFFFSFIVIPPDLYIPNLGLMILTIQWLIGKFALKNQSSLNENTIEQIDSPILKKTKFIRYIGVITLSLYCWENIWSASMRVLFIRIFSSVPAEHDVLMEHFWIQLIYLIFYCLSWIIFIWLWKKVDYLFGMEWLVKTMDHLMGKPTFTTNTTPKEKTYQQQKSF